MTHDGVVTNVMQQHVRDFKGIKESRLRGQPLAVPDGILKPSLGVPADSYLRSHGYNLATQLQIIHAYLTCGSVDEFLKVVTGQGMAEMEAEWLWNEIVRGLED
jgi:hypothetical protein